MTGDDRLVTDLGETRPFHEGPALRQCSVHELIRNLPFGVLEPRDRTLVRWQTFGEIFPTNTVKVGIAGVAGAATGGGPGGWTNKHMNVR